MLKKNMDLLNDYIKNKFSINDENLLQKILFVYISDFFLKSKWDSSLANSTSLELKNIYPFLFDNEITRKFPISKEEISKFFNQEINFNEDFLGIFYEQCLDQNYRKNLGSFYTRNDSIISSLIDLVDYTKEKTVLEPACGSGMLLIALIKKLKEDKNISPLELVNTVFNNYYAIDIDDFACFLTEFNIINELISEIHYISIKNNLFKLPKLKIYKADFTKVPIDLNSCDTLFLVNDNNNELIETNPIISDLKIKQGDFKNGFDIILGNPPFITMYGKRSRNMTTQKREFYNKNYDFVINPKKNNKFNSIMFFLERSIKAINDGQRIGFILDISFFETAFKDIRKYILNNCKILKIVTDLNEFLGVASGQIILILEKGKSEAHNTLWSFATSKESKLINQDIWLDEKNEYKIYLKLEGRDSTIISQIESVSEKLEDIFPKKQLRTCCALTGRSEDFMVSELDYLNDNDNLIFKYLEGAKGVRSKFAKITPTNFLKYDYNLQQQISEEFKIELEEKGIKNKKRIALGDKDAYLAPKIFIRQSAKELIATYTEEKAASNNSIYLLSTKKNSEENNNFLKYTCGLLNSSLLTFYAQKQNIIRMSTGKTPQIKLADLKRIPLKYSNDYFENILKVVNEMLLNGETKKNMEKLNKLVFQLYGIVENDWKYILDEVEKKKL